MVIFASIIGVAIGLPFLKLCKVEDKQAIGVTIGCASHACFISMVDRLEARR